MPLYVYVIYFCADIESTIPSFLYDEAFFYFYVFDDKKSFTLE